MSAMTRPEDLLHNRALWDLVNDQFSGADGLELWRRDGHRVGAVRHAGVRGAACSATWPGWTSSSWGAAPRTSRRGSPGAARGWWPSTSPAPSSPRRARRRPSTGCASRCCRPTPSTCRWPTAAPTWWSASTAPRRGASPTRGSARPPGSCAPVVGWCSSPTARCRRCASRPRAARPASSLLRGPAELREIRWPGGGVEHHPGHGEWIRVLGAPRLRRRGPARAARPGRPRPGPGRRGLLRHRRPRLGPHGGPRRTCGRPAWAR